MGEPKGAVEDSCKILLVVNADAGALVEALKKADFFDVVGCVTGSAQAMACLDAAASPKPDLVIVDLPQSEAEKVFRSIKTMRGGPLVVGFQAAHTVSDLLKSGEAQADCLLGKLKTSTDTHAFAKWLEEWVRAIGSSPGQMMKGAFRAAGTMLAANQAIISSSG